MAARNPRLRELDRARVMIESGHSYRSIGKVLAGRPVHPATHQRITAALEKLGLSLVLSSADQAPPKDAATTPPQAA